MNSSERLELLRERARVLGYDFEWANGNQAWAILDYRPYAPAKLRAIKNNLDELEEWIVTKEWFAGIGPQDRGRRFDDED